MKSRIPWVTERLLNGGPLSVWWDAGWPKSAYIPDKALVTAGAAVLGTIFAAGNRLVLSRTASTWWPSGIGPNKSTDTSSHASFEVSCGCSGSWVVLLVNIVHSLQDATFRSIRASIFGNQKCDLIRRFSPLMPGWPPWWAFESASFLRLCGRTIFESFRMSPWSEIVKLENNCRYGFKMSHDFFM